jgi:hypothetical protein
MVPAVPVLAPENVPVIVIVFAPVSLTAVVMFKSTVCHVVPVKVVLAITPEAPVPETAQAMEVGEMEFPLK